MADLASNSALSRRTSSSRSVIFLSVRLGGKKSWESREVVKVVAILPPSVRLLWSGSYCYWLLPLLWPG